MEWSINGLGVKWSITGRVSGDVHVNGLVQ